MIVLTPNVLMMLIASVIFQVIGLTLMPMTKGLTEIIPSLACGAAFLLGLAMMSRLIASGVDLSVLLPFMAAVIPLCVIAISILFHGWIWHSSHKWIESST